MKWESKAGAESSGPLKTQECRSVFVQIAFSTLPFLSCESQRLSQAAPRIMERSLGFAQNLNRKPQVTPALELVDTECTWDYLVLPIAQSPRNWQHGHHHLRHGLQTWQTSIISEGDYHS